ncbi:retrotransposon-related protein [Trifolium pratense]|uniref:Retrotransposon-related protein n=1 Tax=Trifolium pratense TaxID=57577 RepID=A0A2K3NRA0_TRIPR|nr:retrotransposon-related protein [Trifolium pratense]
MELGGIEMVLGMDWLASLGNIEANFKKLILKWEQEGNISESHDENIARQSAVCQSKEVFIWSEADKVSGTFDLWRRVSVDPKKIEDMLKWPKPKDIKGQRVFLGLTGYYRKFVKNYGRIAWPSTQLLKKDNVCWNDESQFAFEQLKLAMTTVSVLAVPNFEKEFIVEVDASCTGIRAVLMQEGRPVAYMSQTLSDRAQKKSVYERKLMAIVLAIQKWRPYILGRHFQVHTDKKSLRFLTKQRVMGDEQQKWTSKLLGYDFDIKYKPGKENSAADALSRQMLYATLTTVQCEAWEGLEDEVQAETDHSRADG